VKLAVLTATGGSHFYFCQIGMLPFQTIYFKFYFRDVKLGEAGCTDGDWWFTLLFLPNWDAPISNNLL
jgi:hypothetical protein